MSLASPPVHAGYRGHPRHVSVPLGHLPLRGNISNHCVVKARCHDFIGIKDVDFIYAEGMVLGPDAQAKGIEQAKGQLETLAL